MKAKEYFEKYINENQNECWEWRIFKAFKDMFLEVKEIRGKRNAVTIPV